MGANNVIRHGRLTRDPEERVYKTRDGEQRTMASFGLAVNNSYGSKTETSFYDCNVFGKRADAVLKFFRKGSEIVVYGEHEQYEYTNKDGDKRRGWSLTVNEFDFCGNKKDDDSVDVTDIMKNMSQIDESDIPF